MNLIEVQKVTKSFPEGILGKRTVLNDINFTVRQGDFVVLRGANGAGKSTLIKIILGLQEPDRGSVRLFGQMPNTPEAKLHIGTIFQEVTPPNSLKVKELINLVSSYYPEPHSTQEILRMVGLEDKQNAYPSNLSGGQKQRLYFAIALVGNPKLLILDEPTKNLDEEGQTTFWEQVQHCQEAGVTILMVTHIREEQSFLQNAATHIITLADGQLVYDKQLAQPSSTPEPLVPAFSNQQANPVKVLFIQTKAEILQLIRTPIYLIGVLLFSGMASLFPAGDPDAMKLLLVLFSAISLLMFSVDRLGKRIAIERVEGWLKLLKVTPLQPSLYLMAKLMMTMLVLTTSLATIFGIGIYKFGITQSFLEWSLLSSGLLLGTIPFAIAGIALGYIVPPKTLDAITGLLIPVALIGSGLFAEQIPSLLNDLIVLSPFFHYRGLIEFAADIGDEHHLTLHVLWLIFYAALGGLLAKQAYQKDALAK
ncbi:ATP-binding cassette domain-containing protein [Pseudanabaena sp. FACHB-2040]|uniref:ABC transporter ATP-binding protein/permease n=1 Tax=Pseudanabaena sp. FACHB-2040 TaxID=2692859 RepID=UPI0016848EC9|nr:ATP-binding cassette domain-containing protein [Pseudanabaena sp. FACHB-2040]MBD2261190.1 ATP-binding cassette domain-containing protein [Pseudanabaena sp. FACHB-2040]